MRKSRLHKENGNEVSAGGVGEAPWPTWIYLNEPGHIRSFRFDFGISPDLFPLAKEFSETLYRLRLELKPRSLELRYRTIMNYLVSLTKCPEMIRPNSIADISKINLVEYQEILSRPVNMRPVMKRANANHRARDPVSLRTTVTDAWRLGVAANATRPDLGPFGLRNVPKDTSLKKIIYSRKEFKLIVKFLINRRTLPRGATLNSERAYLVACICTLAVFLPINRSSAFMLNENSLHPCEHDQRFDVVVVRKDRPKQSANRLPELKGGGDETDAIDVKIKRKGVVRKIFDENIEYNRAAKLDTSNGLFQCKYDCAAQGYDNIYGRITDGPYGAGMKVLQSELNKSGARADNGGKLIISMRKLRDTLENYLPEDTHMHVKARVLNHKDPDTTGSIYETVTDDDHYKFQKGLNVISVVVNRSVTDAQVWARDVGLSQDVIQRLIDGILKTKVASCTDPIYGELAPKDGRPCANTLACFHCHALAVVVTDLYRIASLERRIRLDLADGVIQGAYRKRFEFILEVIDLEIFSQFEKRLVKAAREKAKKVLHPLWIGINLSR